MEKQSQLTSKSFVTLNNKTKIPIIGLGTARAKGLTVEKAILWALKAGYRHIDTAQFYENETEIGNAIKKSGIKREELFVTTKMPNYFDDAVTGLNDSLKKL